MSQISSYPKTISYGVEGMPYYVPKQPVASGTAYDPQPDGKEIPPLFKPLKIRGLTIQNRIGVSPMCMYSAREGIATPWHLQHYASFATRGPGLIVVEATAVSKEGRISPEDLGIWNDEQAKALGSINELIHSQGQKVGIQIAHAGRKASTISWFWDSGRGVEKDENGWPDEVIAPSPISFKPELFFTPNEMTIDQIHEMVKKFGAAAKRAVEIAKYDFIEIHGAHGYLICEFLSESSNKRTDEYGGSFTNRIRFLTEIIKEIRNNIPEEMPLFIRISGSENVDDDPETWKIDDSKKLADAIIPLGIDLIDVSSGGNSSKQERRGHEEGFHVPLAEELKKYVGDRVLISTVGGFVHGEYVNNLLKDGKCDFVFCGRNYLKNPGLAWQWANELGVKIHKTQEYRHAH